MNISNIPSFNRVKFVSIDNLSFHYVLILNDLKKYLSRKWKLGRLSSRRVYARIQAAGFKAILSWNTQQRIPLHPDNLRIERLLFTPAMRETAHNKRSDIRISRAIGVKAHLRVLYFPGTIGNRQSTQALQIPV